MPIDPIPVADPGAQCRRHAEAIETALADVLASGRFVLGERVRGFEEDFAAYLDIPFCVGVGSGTDALVLALKALDLQAGDEVITVSHSAVATVAAIEAAGGVPVLADIDPVTRCMDPGCAEALIGARTRFILPVHIYGQPAPMEAIVDIAQRRGLKVVEDCAQAHGAAIGQQKVGTLGDAGAFSFYPTKNLGAVGDGGAVVTGSAEVAARLRALREYGWRKRFISSGPGLNSRLDEVQAAVLQVKLPYLANDNRRRRRIARAYDLALQDAPVGTPAQFEGTKHAMHLYVIETDQRDRLAEYLHRRGVATGRHYPQAIHAQPAYHGRLRGAEELGNTEALYRQLLSLPMFPELSEAQVEAVCGALKEWKGS
jgi:dTDP-4-amino-4,6-dideoxygalactose transaminase